MYGEPEIFPLTETSPTAPIHPYAQTKLAVELLLTALSRSGSWRVATLRYFNPVGAHPSGRIGEDPYGIPNNLFPVITQIAAGRLQSLQVFGNDYPTPDGTGIRDYLHVMDLRKPYRGRRTSPQSGCAGIANPQPWHRPGAQRARCGEGL